MRGGAAGGGGRNQSKGTREPRSIFGLDAPARKFWSTDPDEVFGTHRSPPRPAAVGAVHIVVAFIQVPHGLAPAFRASRLATLRGATTEQFGWATGSWVSGSDQAQAAVTGSQVYTRRGRGRTCLCQHGNGHSARHCARGEPSAAPRERCRHSQGPSGGTASTSFGPASKGRPDRLRASSSQCKEQPGTTAVDGKADRE